MCPCTNVFWNSSYMHTSRTSENLPAARGRAKAKVIAVGGAKGGIGKSLLAADLGAANLHLYLGIWGLEHRIDDYLDKKVGHLEQIAVKTAYGTRLIGGGSSRLGSANLPFARKIKLMRAIRGLDAEFVIIDLGGDAPSWKPKWWSVLMKIIPVC